LGFGMMGVFSLLCSFMTNQYAYYIMRAITGIFAAATVGVDPFRVSPDHGCL
jgi:MFS family permease